MLKRWDKNDNGLGDGIGVCVWGGLGRGERGRERVLVVAAEIHM